MRYYRTPKILILSLSPYIAILAAAAIGQGRVQWLQGDMLGVVASGFTLCLFALQIWSARAQLAAAWMELTARQHAADAANRAKSQFLATMSHELRTPLNAVLGMAQALAAEPLAATQRERVRVIRRSSETLLAVLNDLLDLSKIESGALTLEPVEFDLEHLVRGVAAAFQPLAEKQDLTFELQVADAAAGFYRGDSARLRRILYSLCDNAVKFTATGGIALTVDRDGEQLVFTVADTGIGICEADIPHLFEGFFQADATFTRRYGGAGLGLAICGELTTLMNGTIEATSQLEKGSTFTVRLPLERLDPAATQAPTAADQVKSAAGLRVLAAEDNPTNRLVLKSLLAVAGVEPTFANDGQQAVEAWEREPWDIVLMDIQMPQMNGLDATRAIRSRELDTSRPRTPIIAVTANAMTDQVVEYLAAGMDHVVAKPVQLTSLLGAMEQVLAGGDADAAEANGKTRQVQARS
jgi:signal transduction histidine kinase/CheY-like chemotaxis protein